MVKIEIEGGDVFEKLRQSFQNVDAHMENNLRKSGVEVVAIIADRVQQKGEGTDGRLATRAAKRNGAYQQAYALRRAKMGRQTSYVDLTLEGDLFREWDVLATSPTEVIVGFRSSRQAQIAQKLEEQYDEPIFNTKTAEQDFVLEGLANRIRDDLKY